MTTQGLNEKAAYTREKKLINHNISPYISEDIILRPLEQGLKSSTSNPLPRGRGKWFDFGSSAIMNLLRLMVKQIPTNI